MFRSLNLVINKLSMIVCIGIISLCNYFYRKVVISYISWSLVWRNGFWLCHWFALGLQLKRERTFYKIDGKSVLGNITAVGEAKDLIECSFQCIKFGPVPCLSFNLERSNRNVRICELSNTDKYLEPQKIHERPRYDYYGTEFQVSWQKPHYLAFILGC